MILGSLFSGIGGLERGLELAGLGSVAWQVERDPFARKVLAKHWPEVDRSVEDVHLANHLSLSEVDLVCGGFPCQDVSAAGKGAGLAGERSGLWYEFRRILGELAPACVVVENVASGARRWLPHVRRDLHVLGYRTRAIALSAFDVACWGTEPAPSRFLPSTSERPTSAAECSCLLPTPSATSYGSNRGGAKGRVGEERASLGTLARRGLLPTPTMCGNHNRKGASATSGDGIATAVGGPLSPRFVEWLMGFPDGWTEIEP